MSHEPPSPRAELANHIPRRPRVSFRLGMAIALLFALAITPSVTAERWLYAMGIGEIRQGETAGITIRVAPFAGIETPDAHIGDGGVIIVRGEVADRDQADNARAIRQTTPRGALPYFAFFVLAFVFAAIFSHHLRRSTKGRLLRVQLLSLVTVAIFAVAVKILMLATAVSILVVPVALLAMVPTMVLDRVVGLATGILAALVASLLIPFDVSVAIVLLVQAAVAGLVIAEHPKSRWRAAITAGVVTTVFTVGTIVLLTYMTTGAMPVLDDPLSSPLVGAAIGPALATLLAVPSLPIYQLLVGEITHGKLVELENMSHPLLKQIAEKAPGTWQHSLMMANMAEIAANEIGANGRLVRVGAYFHDLGKSLAPKYFIENLEPGETSPHDKLPPEVSCDAIFSHVTEGIVTARRAGLHERIVDFMHMHHGNGVLEYFWARCQEQGNPKAFTVGNFRYPGHPPQSRETAILAICDAVEAASRTLKKPDPQSIDSLVQRIVYGKLHLGQLDESGLSMSDLRRISDSLRETIRHANHGRIEYPWQKAQQDASATQSAVTGTQPRLDSLDRVPSRETRPATAVEPKPDGEDAILLDRPSRPSRSSGPGSAADVKKPSSSGTDLAILETAPVNRESEEALARRRTSKPSEPPPPEGVRVQFRKPTGEHRRLRTESQIEAAESARMREVSESGRVMRPHLDSSSGRVMRPHAESSSGAIAMTGDVGEARKRAATLPPITRARPPSVVPPSLEIPPVPQASSPTTTLPPTASSSLPTVEPLDDQPPMRASGPPLPVDLENAITNPPPLRHTKKPPIATRLPAFIPTEDDLRVTAPRAPVRAPSSPDSLDAGITGEKMPIHNVGAIEDAGRTEPSMPKVQLPLEPPPASDPGIELPSLSDVVDPAQTLSGDPLKRAAEIALQATADRDEWSVETPVVAPTRAELRALLGVADVTRQQSIEEIDQLQRVARELKSDPEILRPPPIVDRRALPATVEVDPEDIEAAIEVAPPSSRRNAIGTAKPKKPQP